MSDIDEVLVPMLIRVLMLLESLPLRRRVRRQIADPHTLVLAARKGRDPWAEISRHAFDLLFIEDAMIRGSEEDFIGTLRALPDGPEVVIFSRRENPERRGALLAAGAYAVIHEGLEESALSAALSTLLARRREQALRRFQANRLGQEPRLRDFVSASPAMQAFLSVVYRVLPADSSLLILGETGVGKERLARALHNEGPRARGPFIQVNCAALPEALLESELFGHKEGAFTGAVRTRRGCFELAHRGTIFLDEICELPFPLQAKLLQVLQDRTLRPVGGEESVPVDVRVVAATNRDMEAEIAARRFREDLYYRLSVVSLRIPPLRERREDIPALLESYREHFSTRLARSGVTGIREEAVTALVRYPWPGNVRELSNVMERAVLLCPSREIDLEDLPESIARSAPGGDPGARPAAPEAPAPLVSDRMLERPWKEVRREVLDSLERQYLARHLERSGGRIGETARRAGMEPRSLHEKMKRLGLRKEDFRFQEDARAR